MTVQSDKLLQQLEMLETFLVAYDLRKHFLYD